MDPAGDPRPSAGPSLANDSHPKRRSRRKRAFTRRIRRSLRPPRALRPTRAGWSFFALTFGVGFASLNTGNNLLYMVLSILLAFLVLSGVFSEAALRGIRVRRKLPRELFVGHSTPVVIEVSNHKKRVPSYAIVVEDLRGDEIEGATAEGRCFFFTVPAGETVSRVHRWTPSERGDVAFAGFRVWTRFPFGLFAKSMTIEGPAELLVYPEISPSPLATGNPGNEATGDQAQGQGGESSEAAGLREYAAGDSFRRIHWPNTLRRGHLLVKDREREQRSELMVQLATAGREQGPEFEAAVSRAASQALAHLDAGWRVGLRSDGAHWQPASGSRQRRTLLQFLARIQPGQRERENAA